MSNEPKARFKIGAVEATVWENTSEGGKTFFTTKITRGYKDAEGKWKNTDNLNSGDLLNAAKVLERAEQLISEQ
jgi:hypothetical protein